MTSKELESFDLFMNRFPDLKAGGTAEAQRHHLVEDQVDTLGTLLLKHEKMVNDIHPTVPIYPFNIKH